MFFDLVTGSGLLIKNLLDFSRSRDQRLPGSFLPSPRGKTLGTRLHFDIFLQILGAVKGNWGPGNLVP
jgi:hypothetical protein